MAPRAGLQGLTETQRARRVEERGRQWRSLPEVEVKPEKQSWFIERGDAQGELEVGRTGTASKFVSSEQLTCELILS